MQTSFANITPFHLKQTCQTYDYLNQVIRKSITEKAEELKNIAPSADNSLISQCTTSMPTTLPAQTTT